MNDDVDGPQEYITLDHVRFTLKDVVASAMVIVTPKVKQKWP